MKSISNPHVLLNDLNHFRVLKKYFTANELSVWQMIVLMNDAHVYMISNTCLAEECNLSKDTIVYILQSLQKKKAINRVASGNGKSRIQFLMSRTPPIEIENKDTLKTHREVDAKKMLLFFADIFTKVDETVNSNLYNDVLNCNEVNQNEVSDPKNSDQCVPYAFDRKNSDLQKNIDLNIENHSSQKISVIDPKNSDQKHKDPKVPLNIGNYLKIENPYIYNILLYIVINLDEISFDANASKTFSRSISKTIKEQVLSKAEEVKQQKQQEKDSKKSRKRPKEEPEKLKKPSDEDFLECSKISRKERRELFNSKKRDNLTLRKKRKLTSVVGYLIKKKYTAERRNAFEGPYEPNKVFNQNFIDAAKLVLVNGADAEGYVDYCIHECPKFIDIKFPTPKMLTYASVCEQYAIKTSKIIKEEKKKELLERKYQGVSDFSSEKSKQQFDPEIYDFFLEAGLKMPLKKDIRSSGRLIHEINEFIKELPKLTNCPHHYTGHVFLLANKIASEKLKSWLFTEHSKQAWENMLQQFKKFIGTKYEKHWNFIFELKDQIGVYNDTDK